MDRLLLLSGNDIPFAEAGVTIHQPRLREIAYIGEEEFFTGFQLLNFSKNMLSEEDKSHLEEQTNFDIFIAILREPSAVMQKNKNCILLVLQILFPQYKVSIDEKCILLIDVETNELHQINKFNFEQFKEIIVKMFTTGQEKENAEQKFSGQMAKDIAKKLKERQERLAKIKNSEHLKQVDIISRYASVLATGQNINLNDIMNYTLYQLFDQITRYQLLSSYDIYLKAKMAGAKDLEDPEDWMGDIHSYKEPKN